MEIKVFELVIDLEDESGVSAIALVDQPAIERDFLKFSKQSQYKFAHDDEKRIVSGYFMVADLPILRTDEQHGEHYVVFRKDTIESIVDKFMRNGLNSSVNLMHDPSKTVQSTFLIESLIVDEARGMFAPESFESAPDGSWFGSMRVLDDEVWESVKDGTFKGFSVEGGFGKLEPVLEDEEIIEETIKELEAEFKNLTTTDERYIIECKRFHNMSKEQKEIEVKSNLTKIKEALFGETPEAVVEETKEETVEVETAKFEDVTTADGTVLSIEPSVELNASVAVMGEEGAEPAPDGEYVLADETVIIVAGGVIVEIPSAEEEVEQVAEVAEDMNEAVKEPKVVIERQEIETKFEAMTALIVKLSEDFNTYKKENEAFNDAATEAIEKFAKSPSAEPTVKTPTHNKFGRSLTPFEDSMKNIKRLNKNIK